MLRQIIPPPSQPTPMPLSLSRPPKLPAIWTQLDPLRQQQLAQQLAELIRRRRLSTSAAEDNYHEQP
jgi:hypothetical protein